MVRDTGVTFPFVGPLTFATMGLAFLCDWAVHGKCLRPGSQVDSWASPQWDSSLGWALLP